jgi:hypothetical protein
LLVGGLELGVLSLYTVELASQLCILEPELVEADVFVAHVIAHVRFLHDWWTSLAKPGDCATSVVRGLGTAIDLGSYILVSVRASVVDRPVMGCALSSFTTNQGPLDSSLQVRRLLLLELRLESRYVEEEMRVACVRSYLFLHTRIEHQILHHVLVLGARLVRSNA